jgi:MFS family permease
MPPEVTATGAAAISRESISQAASFWLVGATFGLFLFAAAAPSPLYGLYAATWHFSAITLTAVFAIYAIALLASLLLTGSLSDSIGRRPVILAGLVIQIASLVLFLLASGAGWLFWARIAQGIATGVATSGMAAALVDLQPADRPGLASVVNSAAPIGGLAIGGLVSAALVQYGPDPLRLVYVVTLIAYLLVTVGFVLIPEPAPGRGGPARLLPRIGVEPQVRPTFVAAVPSVVAGWAVGGFYLSLGPSLVLQLAASHNRLLGGLAIFLISGIGAACVIVFRAWPPMRARIVGGVAVTAGLALSVPAIVLTAPALFFVATAVTGVGFGLSWLGVLRMLVSRVTPGSRGALLAALYIVAYLSFAVPAVIAGYLVTRIGLHDAAIWYAVAVGILAVAGLAGTLSVAKE